MKNNYLEAEQTLKSLKNLDALNKYVSFENIFDEFMNLRGSIKHKLTAKSYNNLRGRVRRSLVFDKNTLELKSKNKNIKEGDQAMELSIALTFPEYRVLSKNPIQIKSNGDIKFTNEVEQNSYKLVLKSDEVNKGVIYPDEIEGDYKISEGKVKSVIVNSYERNSKARNICIEHYGAKCEICNFDFEKKYGVIGKGFIHVHHKIDISIIGKEYEVNPIKDLIPVCPNCHSMLHKKKPAYSIEELRQIMIK